MKRTSWIILNGVNNAEGCGMNRTYNQSLMSSDGWCGHPWNRLIMDKGYGGACCPSCWIVTFPFVWEFFFWEFLLSESLDSDFCGFIASVSRAEAMKGPTTLLKFCTTLFTLEDITVNMYNYYALYFFYYTRYYLRSKL